MKAIVSRKRGMEIISRFADARLLVVGDVMVDHFIWGKVSRISPEAPVPVVEVARENQMLGGSANVLNNITAAGGKALITGIIGDDWTGGWLINSLRQIGIATEGLITEKGRLTTVKTRIVAHNQQIVRFDRESKIAVSPKSVQEMLNYMESACEGLGAIVISDYNKGVVSEGLLDGIRLILKNKNILTCIDPKRSDFNFYRGFDVITPNHHEAGKACGLEDINGDGPGHEYLLKKSAIELLEKCGLKCLLITRGERGISLFERSGGAVHIPAMAKEIYDVTGAGDTVIGIFALCMAAGASYREAAFIANKAAGIVVGKVGTAAVSRGELESSL